MIGENTVITLLCSIVIITLTMTEIKHNGTAVFQAAVDNVKICFPAELQAITLTKSLLCDLIYPPSTAFHQLP